MRPVSRLFAGSRWVRRLSGRAVGHRAFRTKCARGLPVARRGSASKPPERGHHTLSLSLIFRPAEGGRRCAHSTKKVRPQPGGGKNGSPSGGLLAQSGSPRHRQRSCARSRRRGGPWLLPRGGWHRLPHCTAAGGRVPPVRAGPEPRDWCDCLGVHQSRRGAADVVAPRPMPLACGRYACTTTPPPLSPSPKRRRKRSATRPRHWRASSGL